MTKQEALDRVHFAVAEIEKLLDSSPDPDDDEIIALLQEHGIASREVQALVALLPLAFGRAILHQHGLTRLDDRALVGQGKGKSTTIYLSDQPFYKAALKVGLTYLKDGTQAPRAFQLLANRSAELRLLSAVIEGGQRLENGQMSIAFYAEDDVFVKPPWWRRELF